MRRNVEPDLTAFSRFQKTHWAKIWSSRPTLPIERLNREIKRRADVLQIFPDQASIRYLVGVVLEETDEEWQYSERRCRSATSLQHLTTQQLPDTSPPRSSPTHE
jgi:transposase-like protein